MKAGRMKWIDWCSTESNIQCIVYDEKWDYDSFSFGTIPCSATDSIVKNVM